MGLMDVLRGFADPTGGKWVENFRESHWIEIGNLNLGKEYVNVSYSEDSCLEFGNDSSVCIFRSRDFSKLKDFYFAVIIKFESRVIRVMNIRTENFYGKYLDEKLINKVSDGIDIEFNKLPQLTKTLLKKISTLSKKNGKVYLYQNDTWYNKIS